LATPTADRNLDVIGWESLANAEADANRFDFNLMGNAYSGMSGDIAGSRNAVISIFLQTPATDLFFIDADIGWQLGDFGKLVTAPVDIVSGTYRMKTPNMEVFYHLPPDIKLERHPAHGLIETSFAPTGFMRIKREAIDKLIKAYSDEWYTDLNLNVPKVYNFFDFTIDKKIRKRYTEDKTFCNKWLALGEKLWIQPEVTLSHVGKVIYQGRLANHIKNEKE
jgi:hypothetical protein